MAPKCWPASPHWSSGLTYLAKHSANAAFRCSSIRPWYHITPVLSWLYHPKTCFSHVVLGWNAILGTCGVTYKYSSPVILPSVKIKSLIQTYNKLRIAKVPFPAHVPKKTPNFYFQPEHIKLTGFQNVQGWVRLRACPLLFRLKFLTAILIFNLTLVYGVYRGVPRNTFAIWVRDAHWLGSVFGGHWWNN